MKKIDELKLSDALAMIIGGSFTLAMNANDFFSYACAHSIPVESTDVKWIIPIVQKYGYSGLDACVAYIANMEPIEAWKTQDYLTAIEDLKKINPIVTGDIDNSVSYNKEGPYRKVKK